MGSTCKESFEEFLELLKRAGIEITNESELRERLAESHRWRFAFKTLAANGRQIGIRFGERSAGINVAEIRRAFAEFAFPDSVQTVFSASLQAE
ncbi:MAG: hypothetical protein PHY45_04590 [Rhodocyclaceae bacterium]|nr:hypothetical protein [Rhodocyclaceae bacterium]